MNDFDKRIDGLLIYVKALASDMAVGDDRETHERAGHIYNAILSLRRAYSAERKSAVAYADLQRAERLRAGL